MEGWTSRGIARGGKSLNSDGERHENTEYILCKMIKLLPPKLRAALNIPGGFILDNREGFLKGDIVVLGQHTCQKVGMEEIIEVGRHFILYKVKEVGSIPMGGIQIIQLVALNLHPSVLLCLLLLILMAFFPCCF